MGDAGVDREVDEIVEPYPGWPACAWVVRLRPVEAVFTTPERLKAAARGVDAALGEADPVQEDEESNLQRCGDRAEEWWRRPWMPRFPGDMPRITPRYEAKLARGELDEEMIAPLPGVNGADVRLRVRHPPTIQRWCWRLLAFAFTSRALWLVVGAPVEASVSAVSKRLNQRIAQEVLSVPGEEGDGAWERLIRHGPTGLWDQTTQRYPMWVPLRSLPLYLRDVNRRPATDELVWHPMQWWWSSFREYAVEDPMRREGVPRVFPVRADPRRPWLDRGGWHPAMPSEEDLARAWRWWSAKRMERAVAVHRTSATRAAEEAVWRTESMRRWGTVVLGPGDGVGA